MKDVALQNLTANSHSLSSSIPFKIMSRIIVFVLIFITTYFAKGQKLHGLWKDDYMNPMDWYYSFDSTKKSFKAYYLDDLVRTFGQGKYAISGRKVQLLYEKYQLTLCFLSE